MNNLFNLSDRLLKAKLLWILLGLGVIIYSLYVLFVSHTLIYDAKPGELQKIVFVVQRMLIGLLVFTRILNCNRLPIKEDGIA